MVFIVYILKLDWVYDGCIHISSPSKSTGSACEHLLYVFTSLPGHCSNCSVIRSKETDAALRFDNQDCDLCSSAKQVLYRAKFCVPSLPSKCFVTMHSYAQDTWTVFGQ